MLPVVSDFDLPAATISSYHDVVLARSAVGCSPSPVRWPDDLRDPSLSADNFRKRLKTHLFRNALGHLAHMRRCIMHYRKLRLTYLLTYLLELIYSYSYCDITKLIIIIIIGCCAGGRHTVPQTLQVDLLTLKVVSESLLCDMCNLCANFSIPRTLSSRLRLNVRDRRQTDKRHAHHRLMPPTLGAGHNNNN